MTRMEFTKQKLSDANMGYFITHLDILGQDHIVAAPETNQTPASTA